MTNATFSMPYDFEGATAEKLAKALFRQNQVREKQSDKEDRPTESEREDKDRKEDSSGGVTPVSWTV